MYLTVTGQFSTNGITKLLLDNPSPHGTDLALNELTAPAFWDRATHWSFLELHHGMEFSDLQLLFSIEHPHVLPVPQVKVL